MPVVAAGRSWSDLVVMCPESALARFSLTLYWPPTPGLSSTGRSLACSTHLARTSVSTGWNWLRLFRVRLSGKSSAWPTTNKVIVENHG